MIRKSFLILISFVSVLGLRAQNPIIHDQFCADPTARVFNGKLYLFPSHDIPPCTPDLIERKWFCMEDYHVFSSSDMTHWTDHGVILDQKNVPWGSPDAYSMWAPDCVEKNGQYYFYFPDAPKPRPGQRMGGFGVGVAIAQKPEGPYMPMFRPIAGVMGIDPCVLNDEDGQSYIFWSGWGQRVAKLKDNMMEIDTATVTRIDESFPKGNGLKEGPFAFKANGKYYFTFPWVRDETELLAYAMSDSPMGPYEYKGVIMDASATGCWTNHHSIVNYEGQWYLFYHHNDYSPDFDKNRSVCIDSLSFNPDGTIQKVIATRRGVGITKATEQIQIDRYTSIKGATTDYINRANPFEGWYTQFKKSGDKVVYNAVDFADGKDLTTVKIRYKAAKAAKLQVKTTKGMVIADVKLAPSKNWTIVSLNVSSMPSGKQDLVVEAKGSTDCQVDWIGFGLVPNIVGAMQSGQYRNLIAELGFMSEAETKTLVNNTFEELFFGKNRIYFEVNDSMAYVSDIKNNDVRTEGMSYGLMTAVQMNRKDCFDKLWRWAKCYMQHQDGSHKGYFAWSNKLDGTKNSNGAASDGELYFVTSLIFASNQWGNESGINYLAEAQNIINNSFLKTGMDRVAPLINLNEKLITFTPDNWGGRYTDPSYHLPVFYEIWAEYLNDGRSGFWKECAAKSREYLHKCMHPETGLNPDYSNYDGSLMGGRGILGDAFRFDSWRVPMNIALDYTWAGADVEWQQQYANRIQNFLYAQGVDKFVDQFNIDGTTPARILPAGGYTTLRHSLGFVSTAAAASLVATHSKGYDFVKHMLESKHEPYSDGYFDAYYDGFLHLFAIMHLTGNYRVITPAK